MARKRIGRRITGPNGEAFELKSRLGNGAFGEVFKATGVESNAYVAVKMVPPNKLNDPQALAVRTVLNETKVEMLKVDHPNVVRVLHVDAGSDASLGPYLIMEFIAGGNLQNLVDAKRSKSSQFTFEEALSLMRSIAMGAQAVNEHMIHRDIKPDNILIDNGGATPVPKLADFGLARIASEYTRAETFKGIQMFWYKAPEVWRQEKNTFKIDVYSVGLVFYQLLTLEHPLMQFVSQPYDADRWREVHLTTPCPDVRSKRADVPLNLAKLLLRMVDKSAGNRPNWDEVISDLTLKQAVAASAVQLNSHLLAAVQNQANERFRDEQNRTANALAREKEMERKQARQEEIKQSGLRMLARFDEVIAAINEHEATYPIQILGEGTLKRDYVLSNGRTLHVEIFGGVSGKHPQNRLLAAGYIGVEGGLSANLILTGQLDDIPSALWSAMEVTVMALIYGEARLKLYREAGLSDSTIRYAEFMNGNEPWRRDSPSYFGFRTPNLLIKHFGFPGMDVYQLQTSDLDRVFNDVLMLGIRMPRKT
ncbi:MAG: serine/threonine-protein kinase [Pyrinomonadaceae bacterium]